MKPVIALFLLVLLCSCENKNHIYADKYEKILKEEQVYIDSIGLLPYVGITTMASLGKETNRLDSLFNLTTKEHAAKEYQPSQEQLEWHLEIETQTKLYLDNTDFSKK